jgi:hypothetical protein
MRQILAPGRREGKGRKEQAGEELPDETYGPLRKGGQGSAALVWGLVWSAAVFCSAALVFPVWLRRLWSAPAKNQTRNQSGRAKHCRTPHQTQNTLAAVVANKFGLF